VACAKCPYTSRYDVLWRHEVDPDLKCVMLRCCSGPELRILQGEQVLRSEIFKSPDEVRSRAAALRGQAPELLAETG
jgi:hypothetical protein